jgi:hypothetical protein
MKEQGNHWNQQLTATDGSRETYETFDRSNGWKLLWEWG